MTRANIHILTGQGCFKFQSNSSAYPSYMMEAILKFATSTGSKNATFKNEIGFYDNPDSRELSTLIEECGLTLGSIGNFNYVYEIDFIKQTVKVWDSTTYWVTAPENWKARGWHCYEGEKGSFGYTNWKKRKLLYTKKFTDLVKDVKDHTVILNDGVIEEAIKIN